MADMGVKMVAAAPPNRNGDTGEVERERLVACIDRFCVDGLEERCEVLIGDVEGEVEEEGSASVKAPQAEEEGLPVGVEGPSASSSSSSVQEGMAMRAEEEEEKGAVEEKEEVLKEVETSSSESTSLNSCEKDASFHSRAARASECGLVEEGEEEEGKAAKSSPKGSSDEEEVVVVAVDWKVPQASS